MEQKKMNKYLALVNLENNTVCMYTSCNANRRLINKYINSQKDKDVYRVYLVDAFKMEDVPTKLSDELKIKLTRIKRPRKDIKNITNKMY